MISVTRRDLDAAIEAGDWAAVGATAALLAIASDSQSSSSRGKKPIGTDSTLSEIAVTGSGIDNAATGVAVAVAAAVEVARSGFQDQVISDDASSASDSSSDTSESMLSSSINVPPILRDPTLDARISSSPSSDSGSVDAFSMRQRSALEVAIEAGDWVAVGEAAAMLSDTSVKDESTVRMENIAELDDMLNRGDWSGIVEAANRRVMSESSSTGDDGTRTSFPSYGDD
jgi:hypothetical protein